MTRADSDDSGTESQQNDQSAWLDLVSRLEAMPPTAPESADSIASVPERQDVTENPASEPVSNKSFFVPAYRPRDYIEDATADVFVPEEPESLSSASPQSVLAWLGAVGAPIALLVCVIFFRSAPAVAIWGLIAIFVASVVFLMWRLPQEKDEYDDGARL